MSKKIIWVFAAILFAALGAALWLWYQQGDVVPAPAGQSGSTPSASSPVPSAQEPTPSPATNNNTFLVATQSGSTLTVQDFTGTSELLPGNTKSYELEENESFAIEYSGLDQSFVISLTKAPFADTQKAAEAAFLQKLNTPRDRACSLKVMVTIPGWASDAAVGINYGLSWCPFAIPVPNN